MMQHPAQQILKVPVVTFRTVSWCQTLVARQAAVRQRCVTFVKAFFNPASMVLPRPPELAETGLGKA